jgi:hypothetical protein
MSDLVTPNVEVEQAAQSTPPTEIIKAAEAQAAAEKATETNATTPESQAGETPAEETKKTEVEPYELKLENDSPLSSDRFEKIAEYARLQGFTKEQAEELVKSQEETVKSLLDTQQKELIAKSEKWVEDIRADKEIGQDNFNKSMEFAARAINKFATQELKETLNATRLGDYPELVRMMARVGAAMADDTFVSSSETAGDKKRLADILYKD